MRSNRLYVDQAMTPGAEVAIDADAAHYLSRVLRLRAGAALRVFDGCGNEFQATVTRVTRKGGLLAVDRAVDHRAESSLQLTLAQGVSRGERMDMVMQKATELGVQRIEPLLTERSVVRLDEGRSNRRTEHWRRIVINACEQSGRNVVPPVKRPAQFDLWLEQLSAPSLALLLQPDASRQLRQLTLPADKRVMLIVGPEGGLTPGETQSLQQKGFIGVSLGPRILRTETAGIAAIAALQALWGDL